MPNHWRNISITKSTLTNMIMKSTEMIMIMSTNTTTTLPNVFADSKGRFASFTRFCRRSASGWNARNSL